MKYKIFAAAMIALSSLFVSNTSADLVYFSDYVWDTETNLDYKKFNAANDGSWEETIGGPLDIFFGISEFIVPISSAPANQLAAFLKDQTTGTGPIDIIGIHADGDGFYNISGFSGGTPLITIGSYTTGDLGDVADNAGVTIDGYWMARTHSVPVPGALLLFVSALSGLGALRIQGRV